MKSAPVKCSTCDKQTRFAEYPYNTPGATRYWTSTYDPCGIGEDVASPLFVVQRQTPSKNKKGKITVRTTNEYITAVFCDAKCGVEYGNREKVSSGDE